VDPSHVKVLLDLPIKKKVPIQASWSGKLPEHLILVRATITPEKIELIGRNQILSNISTIYTEKVFLDKIKKSGSITVGLAVHPDFLKAGPGKKDKVTINYEVKVRK
jgi:YbbR domain-containing protein